MWHGLKDENCLRTMGRKIMKGRYGDLVKKTDEVLEHTQQRLFFYSNCLLEMDMLGTAKFAKLVLRGVQMTKGTSRGKETPEEEQLRKSCANQLVVATMEWLNPETVLGDKALVVAGTPWNTWMGKSSAVVRSVDKAVDWMQRQFDHGFLDAVNATFDVLVSAPALLKAGLIAPKERTAS